MHIKTWRDPYCSGFSPTYPKEIEINPGLTVLVGCNGSGKTTLLLNIKEEMKKNNIPVHMWNNLHDGGSNVIGSIFAGYGEEGDDIGLGVSLLTASEGEAIKLNLGRESHLYKEFLKSGLFKNRNHRMSLIFSDKKKEQDECNTNKRVLLFDAVDSGLSVDAIVEVKSLFDLILNDAKKMGLELYLIISANEYELARNANCFNVNVGKYITFADYEDYRKFIIKSRQKKEKRIERQIVWKEKQRKKAEIEFQKTKERYEQKIQAIKEKAMIENRELTFSEKYQIKDLEEELLYKNNKIS